MNNERPTKAIRNAGRVLNIRRVATNKISTKLKMTHSKMPNTAYSNRWAQLITNKS